MPEGMRRALVMLFALLMGCAGDGVDRGEPDAAPQPDAPVEPQQVCGDDRCVGETEATCCRDCGCPSGMMCAGVTGCVAAAPTCGDQQCQSPETQASCCVDCGCAQGSSCTTQGCVSQPSCGDGECSNGESSSTCCEDCPCAAGLDCTSHACVDPATCGDGTCAATEAGRCCKDCGCRLGTLCSGDGLCKDAGTANLIWTVRDRCFNGESIQLRFFDRTDRLLWPTPTTVYVLTQGNDQVHNLMCTKGARICYGANQPTHQLYWGVDIDNSKTCTTCCFVCDNKEAASELTCP
jgi:hypothetical protein